MSTADHRQFPRYAIALDCVILHGGTRTEARSRDISKSGVSCVAPAPLDVSSVIELELALAFGDDTFSEPLRLKAIVVWCTPLREGGYQVGAKFAALTPELSHFIDVFARYLEG